MRLAAASRAHVDYRRDLLGLLAVVKVAEAELAVLSAAPCAQPPINERDECVAASDGDGGDRIRRQADALDRGGGRPGR